MDHIFIISTSHHLIQLISAVKHFDLKKEEVQIIVMCAALNKKVLEEDLKRLGFININIFEYWTFKEILKGQAKDFICFLKRIKKCCSLYISQYSSDYSLLANSILKPKSLYLLDEGTASFLVAKTRIKLSTINWRFIIKTILYGEIISLPKKLIYYTQYDIENVNVNDQVVKYSFNKHYNSIEFDNASILILGSSIVEVEIVKKELYFKILNDIKSCNSEKSIFYYPHRKENETKLKEIENLGIIVLQTTEPFENYFEKLNTTSEVYYSFYSPVLDNLSKMYQNIPQLRVLKINEFDLLKNHQIIEEIYSSYSKNQDIQIININEIY